MLLVVTAVPGCPVAVTGAPVDEPTGALEMALLTPTECFKAPTVLSTMGRCTEMLDLQLPVSYSLQLKVWPLFALSCFHSTFLLLQAWDLYSILYLFFCPVYHCQCSRVN